MTACKFILRWNGIGLWPLTLGRDVSSRAARPERERSITLFRETAMREGKLFAVGTAMPAQWPVDNAAQERPSQSPWKIGRWFARRPPTLFQRCLAVHIYHASKQTSLH
jgi:hypothetical protein